MYWLLHESSRREVEEDSDKLKRRDLYMTARFRYKVLTNYVLQSEAIYVSVCTRIEAKSDWNVVKVSARISIDLN